MKTKKKIKLSIIIVYFGGYKHLLELIQSIKKNEIKITVIAANFPESHNVRKMFFNNDKPVAPVLEEEAPVEKKGIFNSFASQTAQSTPPTVQNTIEIKKQEAPTPIQTVDDDSEWGAVPAFLRRSKLK